MALQHNGPLYWQQNSLLTCLELGSFSYYPNNTFTCYLGQPQRLFIQFSISYGVEFIHVITGGYTQTNEVGP